MEGSFVFAFNNRALLDTQKASQMHQQKSYAYLFTFSPNIFLSFFLLSSFCSYDTYLIPPPKSTIDHTTL